MIFNLGGGGGSSSSGGSGLVVIGSPTVPTKISNNTIWVNTDVPVTEYVLGQSTPKYSLDSSLYGFTSEENITLYTVDGRNHIKVNGGEAIYTFAKSVNGYWALMLVSPISGAVTTKNTYKASETRPYQGTVEYEGVTYYWGRCDYGSSGTFNVTPKYSGSATPEELALLMAAEYHNLKESAESEYLKEGAVWISIGNSTPNKISAPIGDDWIEVYPISAKQCINGEWVDKPAQSYLNGVWTDWIPTGALYWHGNECKDVTGGWECKAWKLQSDASTNAQTYQIDRYNDHLYFSKTGDIGAVMYAVNPIDLTGVNAVRFKGVMSKATKGNWCAFHIWTKMGGSYWATNSVASVTTTTSDEQGKKEFTLNVSSLSGPHYLGFGIYNANCYVKVEELCLEV